MDFWSNFCDLVLLWLKTWLYYRIVVVDLWSKKFFFLSCFSTEKYSFHFQTRFPGCDRHSIIRYKFLYIVHFLYLCWPIAWLKHGVQIKVLELSSSFSRFLIKFPYYSSGFEIIVCHSNWANNNMSGGIKKSV